MWIWDVMQALNDEIKIYSTICWQGEKRSSGLFAACAFARLRGGRAKLERKDFPSGPAERVRLGRIGVEGLCDFRRGMSGSRIWYPPFYCFYQNSLRPSHF